MKGWVKLHRKISEGPIGRNAELRGVFEELLLRANHKKGYTEDGTILDAGQLMTSHVALSKFFNLDRLKIRRILLKLKNAHLIEHQTSSKNTIITILNWDKFQSGEHDNEHQVNIKRTSSEHQVNTNKNVKNEKNERSINNPAKKPIDNLCFIDAEFHGFVASASEKMQQRWANTYTKDYINESLIDAYEYYTANKRKYKSPGNFFNNWLKRGWEDYKVKTGLKLKELDQRLLEIVGECE